MKLSTDCKHYVEGGSGMPFDAPLGKCLAMKGKSSPVNAKMDFVEAALMRLTIASP
jgi:hypothetical protein